MRRAGGAPRYRTSLRRMLDALDDAVIAVTEGEEIRFCNSACESLLCHPAEDLRGRMIWSIFRTRTVEVLRPCLCCLDSTGLGEEGKQQVFRVGLVGRTGNDCFVNVQIVPLLSESSLYYLFILKCPGNASGFICQQRHFPGNSVDEKLAAIQERLRELDDILAGVLPESSVKAGEILYGLSEINRFFVQINLLLRRPPSHGNDSRFFAVRVMNLCVAYWQSCSGADKFDLARSSKLWTVYINPDGWERTQTLDKYFDLNTLPKRPNWKKVLATADFVLHSCLEPSPLRENLEKNVEQLFSSMEKQHPSPSPLVLFPRTGQSSL